ncbi:hypothetical protein KIH87_05755 [Paraneptunicella aestuarii]|uniref:hypothetical protein n=1 Tax=Paraneptunicella aestuarii TaxID=2831148 RepID=UPI001E548492|nr:hypothetical protein [Paraneptunicella aestuarii]UAA39858.1 hypothetical protein KIH87_05755 [Paraneptunicella aestuarii]
MKKSVTLLGALTLMSSAAMADTFTVDVDVDVTLGETPLSLVQTAAMSFPQVKVDEATVVGADCHSSSSNGTGFDNRTATNANSLCPGLNGSESQVTFTGVPNAVISVTQGSTAQTTNGMRFTTNYNSAFTRTLSGTDGTTNVSMQGTITMVDKAAVSDGLLTFTYDVSAAYQ